MITHAELAAIHGIIDNTARKRLIRAGIKPKRIGNTYYYPREKAIEATADVPLCTPAGTITISELAEIAGRHKRTIEYRLRKAGIEPVGKMHRRGSGKGCAGGYPMKLYPQRTAIYASKDKD